MTITHTTNVNRGIERVKLSANLAEDGTATLVWASHYRAGELKGCGPTLVGLEPELAHECSMRLESLFPGTMLWRSERPNHDRK